MTRCDACNGDIKPIPDQTGTATYVCAYCGTPKKEPRYPMKNAGFLAAVQRVENAYAGEEMPTVLAVPGFTEADEREEREAMLVEHIVYLVQDHVFTEKALIERITRQKDDEWAVNFGNDEAISCLDGMFRRDILRIDRHGMVELADYEPTIANLFARLRRLERNED